MRARPAPAAVKLALDWLPEPEFGGFYAARESGAYKTHGILIEIQGGGAGVPVLQMVATGRADFGTVGADELLTARARGADLVALFAVFQTSPQGIMVHASRKLQKLEDAFHSGTLALETGKAYAAYLKKKFAWDGVKVVPYDGGVAHFLADSNELRSAVLRDLRADCRSAQRRGSCCLSDRRLWLQPVRHRGRHASRALAKEPRPGQGIRARHAPGVA